MEARLTQTGADRAANKLVDAIRVFVFSVGAWIAAHAIATLISSIRWW